MSESEAFYIFNILRFVFEKYHVYLRRKHNVKSSTTLLNTMSKIFTNKLDACTEHCSPSISVLFGDHTRIYTSVLYIQRYDTKLFTLFNKRALPFSK